MLDKRRFCCGCFEKDRRVRGRYECEEVQHNRRNGYSHYGSRTARAGSVGALIRSGELKHTRYALNIPASNNPDISMDRQRKAVFLDRATLSIRGEHRYRHRGLKIRRGQPRGGSTPPPGTKILKELQAKWPLDNERPFCLVAVLVAVGFLLFRSSGTVRRQSGGGFLETTRKRQSSAKSCSRILRLNAWVRSE
jgi:hypothetical protein